MSQFPFLTGGVMPPPGGGDPLGAFTGFGPSGGFNAMLGGMQQAQGRAQGPQGGRRPQGGIGGFKPVPQMAAYGSAAEMRQRQNTGQGPFAQRDRNNSEWNALFSQAVFGDMARQQGIMDEQFGRLNQGMGRFEGAFTQGADRMREIAGQQRQTLGAEADRAQQLGQQGYDDFLRFRDQQLSAVGQDIERANQQAAGAVSSFEGTMGEYKDRTALQASNLAVGLGRQVQNAMQQLAGGLNPDGTMMTPAERAALQTTMQRDVAEQTSMGINQIYSQFNDTMASMGANLAQLKQAQAQTTMAGGQLRGQVGTAFGGQTIDAQRMRASMTELSSNLRTTMEQMSAASELGAINLLTGGYKDMYDMIQGNKRGTTSMYAALSGWLAGMTTPALGAITPPNFRSM